MEDCEGGWEELRKEARKIEGDLDVKLSSYAKLGGMLSHGGGLAVIFALVYCCIAYCHGCDDLSFLWLCFHYPMTISIF